MIKKIILIDHENYTVRREELFYIQELIKFGYKVEIWDISQLLYPGIIITGGIDKPFVHKINEKRTLKGAFERVQNTDTAFIVEVPESFQNRYIFRWLANCGCKTIKINCYGNSEIKKSNSDKLKKLLQGYSFRVLKDQFFFRINLIYKKQHHIHFPDYYLTSNFEPCSHHINHPDFEKIRDFDEPPIQNGKYIVFVDMFFPDHPDFKTLCKTGKLPNSQSYRDTMTHYFNYLEARYQMPVVIAAHPKATYQGNEFGKRNIIRLHTDNLIHYCQKAVLHISCALSYLIYENVPTVFVSTDEILEMKQYIYGLKKLTEICHKTLYNLNHIDFSQTEFSAFEERVREDYLYTYLTSPETEHLNNRDILHNLLLSI